MKTKYLFIAICLIGTSLSINKNLKSASTITATHLAIPTPEMTLFKSVFIAGSQSNAVDWFKKK